MSDPIEPWPVVRKGDQGHPILTLQQLLRAHRQSIAVDGVFGPVTENAVKALQRTAGLQPDGVVGPRTWPRAILVVRRGSRGDAVRGVQVEISFRDLSGQAQPPLDGIFGPQVEQSVRDFQNALGIAVDGIVGPVTWRAYVSGMLSF